MLEPAARCPLQKLPHILAAYRLAGPENVETSNQLKAIHRKLDGSDVACERALYPRPRRLRPIGTLTSVVTILSTSPSNFEDVAIASADIKKCTVIALRIPTGTKQRS